MSNAFLDLFLSFTHGSLVPTQFDLALGMDDKRVLKVTGFGPTCKFDKYAFFLYTFLPDGHPLTADLKSSLLIYA